jgi:hypothetical protein
MFQLTANGANCDVSIAFDAVRQRCEIRSPELDERYYAAIGESNESLTRYFNRTQSFRVLPSTSGYFPTNP